MAEAMQGQLRGVGIDLQVQKMERGPYLDFIRAYKHGLAASSSTSIDPDGILRTVYHTENKPASNFAGLSDPELDGMLVRGAQQSIGSPERRRIYEDAQRRLMESVPYVGIFSQVRVEAMTAKVQGLRMGPDGLNALPLTDVWLEA